MRPLLEPMDADVDVDDMQGEGDEAPADLPHEAMAQTQEPAEPQPAPEASEAAEPAEIPEASGTGPVPADDEGRDRRFKLPPRVVPAPGPPRNQGHVAPTLLSLDRVDEDPTFQLRPVGEVSLLATDIARLGQLFPVDLRLKGPDRLQVVCGFRRVAALRFLQRDKVLARVHADLSDEDALLMALADAIHALPVARDELEEIRSRLQEEGRLGAEAKDMLEKALAEGEELAPESPEEEVDADELATQATFKLGELNQDLALLADVFASLDREKREALLEQLRYSAELVAYLEGI